METSVYGTVQETLYGSFEVCTAVCEEQNAALTGGSTQQRGTLASDGSAAEELSRS
jgi:hypothetical protein